MFTRTTQLIGQDAFERLQQTRIILFGVGGVGGWCAEALVRTGIRHLTIVDFDTVATSNLNRQIVATQHNIGEPKAEQMRLRLLSLNPQADIIARCERFGDPDILIQWSDYDIVIDAIDSVAAKARLLYEATAAGKRVFSSMGAARKTDAGQVKTAEFKKVIGCPLARAVRQKMKQTMLFPQGKVMCVYSEELSGESGTIAPVVGTFGMQLAGLVINDIIKE